MKQTEKLNLILNVLYDKPEKTGEIVQLLSEKGIDITLDDAHRLGRRLADAGYVRFTPTRQSAWVDMRSEGIEFVEGDSFTSQGNSVVINHQHEAIISNPKPAFINQSKLKGLDIGYPQPYTAPLGKTYFLGIGINEYIDLPDLNNARKDIEDISNMLTERYQFEPHNTRLIYDSEATRGAIIDEIHSIMDKVSGEDRVLIYFSGHGLLKGNLGYWAAHDSQQNSFSSFVSNSDIRDSIMESKARHILLISDSCFSESLHVRNADNPLSKAYLEWENDKSRWIFSSGKGIVSDGPKGENSPLAKSLLHQLKTNTEPILNIAKLADTVTKEVSWNYWQKPESSPLFHAGHDGGQFLFYLKTSHQSEAFNPPNQSDPRSHPDHPIYRRIEKHVHQNINDHALKSMSLSTKDEIDYLSKAFSQHLSLDFDLVKYIVTAVYISDFGYST